MKRFSLVLMTVLMGVVMAYAKDGDTFTAKTVEGVDMRFRVISENEKTCQVGDAFRAIDKSTVGVVTIPSEANGYKVVAIGNSAFYDCEKLSSVSIPSSITKIDNRAFQGCSTLSSINIPNSVTAIGESAFAYCSGITSITLPNSLTTIGANAFSGCI